MTAPAAVDAVFATSADAFRRFFVELRESFLERDALFTQLELALLCREHVLIIGPPGTAKSAVAQSVVGRIIDESTGLPSLFSKQLAENTVQTDLIGSVDFKVLTETGRTEYLTDEGMLGAEYAFLDEVFDGRDMLLRSILNVLYERELKHGRKVTTGKCETAVLTSNRYLSEVLQRSPETLQAFADRISFICFTPKSFARKGSRAQMLWQAQASHRPQPSARLTLQQLDALKLAVDAVEIPAWVAEGLELLADMVERELTAQVSKLPDYVPTKYFSQRSIVKAQWAVKAAVVRDKIYERPDRTLVATVADLAELKYFFLLGGPTSAEVELLLQSSSDPRERAQLEILRVEHRAFTEAFTRLEQQLERRAEIEAEELSLARLRATVEAVSRDWQPQRATELAKELKTALTPGPRHPENRAPLVRFVGQLDAGLRARLTRAKKNVADSRGENATVQSFLATFALLRAIPEMGERTARLAVELLAFSDRAAEVLALQAEETEYEELRSEFIAARAANLADDADGLAALVQAVGLLLPEPAEASRKIIADARVRAERALGRRARRAFNQQTRTKGSPIDMLMAEGRRVRDLDDGLRQLEKNHAPLRTELLTPIGERYARQVLSDLTFQRLEEFNSAIEAMIEDLTREGVPLEPVLLSVWPDIELKLREHVNNIQAVDPRIAAPSKIEACDGTAYKAYNEELVGASIDGELAAMRNLARLVNRSIPSEYAKAVSEKEFASLVQRARFLQGWLRMLLSSLPLPDQLTSVSTAERAFATLVASRLPLLVTRDAEVLRLATSFDAFRGEEGERGTEAARFKAQLWSLADDLRDYAEAVLKVQHAFGRT